MPFYVRMMDGFGLVCIRITSFTKENQGIGQWLERCADPALQRLTDNLRDLFQVISEGLKCSQYLDYNVSQPGHRANPRMLTHDCPQRWLHRRDKVALGCYWTFFACQMKSQIWKRYETCHEEERQRRRARVSFQPSPEAKVHTNLSFKGAHFSSQ